MTALQKARALIKELRAALKLEALKHHRTCSCVTCRLVFATRERSR